MVLSDAPPKRLTVEADQTGQRLDRWLADRLGVGRKAAQRLIESGKVARSTRRATKSEITREGTEYLVHTFQEAAAPDPTLKLDVCFENEFIVVANKPSGQPTAPLRPGETGTLVNALVARYPEMEGVGYRAREPGILHRLDTATSGLVLAARDAQTFDELTTALKDDRIVKRYQAVVHGWPRAKSFVIESLIVPHPRDTRRVECIETDDRYVADYSKVRTTQVVVTDQDDDFSDVTATVHRAYRHQVRAHLAWNGTPIVGDSVYAPNAPTAERLALHAGYIAGATRGSRFEVEAAPPDDFGPRLGRRAPSD